MRFEETGINGLALIHLAPIADGRGWFARTFCEEEFAAAGYPFRVVQANLSHNAASQTLRGLHYQCAPYGEPKIVSCRRGRIWDVAVDLREGSPTLHEWRGFELMQDDHLALFIDAGFAHGFLTLEHDSDVEYLMGAPFALSASAGLRWDDPALAIAWPLPPLVISERDRSYELLQ